MDSSSFSVVGSVIDDSIVDESMLMIQ